MSIDNSTTQFNFKAQLETAVNLGLSCARFEWYGPPSPDDPKQPTLDGSGLFVGGQIIEQVKGAFHFAETYPDSNQPHKIMIYVFDGSASSPKFHAYLWTPAMGQELLPFEYFKPADANPYHPYVMATLRAQNGPTKVSTVVKQSYAAVRKAQASGLPQYLPMDAHQVGLRDTLMGLRHTDPLIHFTPISHANKPHIDRGSLVEHLCAYDRNPTWNLRIAAFEECSANASSV